MMKRLTLLVLAVLVLVPGHALAGQDWQSKERQCMQACPRMPRFSGIETDAQYQARMQAQAAHDRCQLECARQSAENFPPSFTPISKSAADYYHRNTFKQGAAATRP